VGLVQHRVGMLLLQTSAYVDCCQNGCLSVPTGLSSEYRSSQRSVCCHTLMTDRSSSKRVTVKQCVRCKTLLSRDLSAACVILDIFRYQRSHTTTKLPPFIYREDIDLFCLYMYQPFENKTCERLRVDSVETFIPSENKTSQQPSTDSVENNRPQTLLRLLFFLKIKHGNNSG
jgi:hypothetical protein